MRVASIVYLDFLDAHGGYYMATVYIHVRSFFAIQFNSRKTKGEGKGLALLYNHQKAETLNT